ncbi:MAG: HEAT repeat domain-containing protein [Planctomycetes bacterium]|nr:HEAT repeat domain-containing protein [Planctomycetota bacterium]
MWKPLFLCALLLSPAPLCAAPSAPLQAEKQDAKEKPDKRPEVAEKVEKLKDLISDRKGEKDTDAIGVIDELVQEFPNCGPKDRKDVVSMLSKCFEQRRLVKEGDPPNNKLNMAAAVALSTMAPESTKELLKWIGQKDLKKDQALQTRLVDSLGKTKDKEALKPLEMLLNSKDDWMVAAAGSALSNFGELELTERKAVFETVLKNLTAAKSQTDGNPNDTVARARYDVIGAPLITALQKLSKHDERDPVEWQRWWNKNKRDNWDAEK